jgi:hypothetical protein
VTGKRHEYQVVVTWTGNLGEGTASYAAYSRDHDVSGEAKPTILGTADPAFGGDLTRWNPEELFVACFRNVTCLSSWRGRPGPALWLPGTSTSRVAPCSKAVTVGRSLRWSSVPVSR